MGVLSIWFKGNINKTVKGLFKGVGQFFRYLLFTPSWGSKRRAEQQAYENRLDEAMARANEEKGR